MFARRSPDGHLSVCGEPLDLGHDVVDVRPDARLEVFSPLLLVSQIDRASAGEHRTMLLRKAGDIPRARR
jgi:hypothetical protein